jgi:hypothetical protein
MGYVVRVGRGRPRLTENAVVDLAEAAAAAVGYERQADVATMEEVSLPNDADNPSR